jgi:hypothetical protein
VFYTSTSTLEHADIGPHHRWSTGILIDNVTTDGQIRVQDRADSGSGHGWSGAQIMFWNCTSPDIVVQDPPSYHCNWAIGCVGPITNVGQWTTNPLGIVESKGKKIVAIPSLFKAQLKERLKELQTDITSPTLPTDGFQILSNPAEQQLSLKYDLTDSSIVSIDIYNLEGKKIGSILANRHQTEGSYFENFNTSPLVNGVYFVRFSTGKVNIASKFIVQTKP